MFKRLLHIAEALVPVPQTEVPEGPAAEKVIKTLAKFFKLMCSVTKMVMQAKPKFVPQQFQKLVAFIGRRVTGQAYTFLSLLQTDDVHAPSKPKKQKGKGKGSGKGKENAASQRASECCCHAPQHHGSRTVVQASASSASLGLCRNSFTRLSSSRWPSSSSPRPARAWLCNVS